MAKKTDDDFDFGDEGAEDGGATPGGKGGKGAGGVGGLLAKLPVAGLLDKVRGLGDAAKGVAKGGKGGKGGDGIGLPVILAGVGVLALVLLLIVMTVLLVGSLSGSGTSQRASRPAVSAEPASSEPLGPGEETSPMDGASQAADESAGSVSGWRETTASEPMADPFFSTPLLPDEGALMAQGEVRYGREPQAFWRLADIKSGWPDLDKLWRSILRERNSRDFSRLIGAPEPKPDTY